MRMLDSSVIDLQRRAEETLRSITATDGADVLQLYGIYADDGNLTLVFR